VGKNQYKSVDHYANDWRLLFNNARQYNQEGSWVYNDAEEMNKIFESTFYNLTAGTSLPGALPRAGGGPAPQYSAGPSSHNAGGIGFSLSDDEDEPVRKPVGRGRRLKNDSDDEYEGDD